ncbi:MULTISPECIES: S66 family peptidase [Bifidobacterium]|nr:S66 peptidase family protein [Bifidobacterium tibiigranuli]MCH3974900.1 LD-carboxypeptidase [Bifidobacterium tibiigranuli]MCH4190009.1 LD-carboxypeptidase [Bifidobacterium tibiigranuli]MCH4202660.1 LD-carboxypeptidase [Bifidobacterium tibiigranuli]MCH4273678.1 LD-carboxypeptidase [Bifidobacterium tibiigranuli]MCI1210801.1 LD-carboxypeptidase [Bifidobacterium tibiigranuli]
MDIEGVNKMIKPNTLKAGDTVALVSLSSGIAGEEIFSHRVEIAKVRLENDFGLNVVITPNAMKGIDFLDKNPQLRAKDLMDAFMDTDIKAVISMIGGDDTIRLLPFIDFDILQKNPKVFMGYSDTTVNHFMMYKAGITSFYGPCVFAEFAENGSMHSYTKEYLKKVLFEKHDTVSILPSQQWTSEFLDWANPENNTIFRTMLPDSKGYELLQGNGVVKGRLIGGCVDVFPMIVGTEIWPNKTQWENSILFLETSEEYPSPNSLKYLLRGMAAQGLFDEIVGIIFGKPKDEKYYSEYKDVLMRVVGKEVGRYDLPILYNMNFGHTAPICTLPYGIMAEINCSEKSFKLIEAATC